MTEYPLDLTLEIKGEDKNLYDALIVEFNGKKEDRSKLLIENLEKTICVKIKATDPAALQASFNSFIQLFNVYKKTKGVVKNGF